MRLSADAMEEALRDFRSLQYSTELGSLYESFLVGRWLEAHNRYPVTGADEEKKQEKKLGVSDANEAVTSIFVLSRDHPLGRLAPFRFAWRLAKDSGRKTVWNNTTRGHKLATTIFEDGDIRNGLKKDAADIVESKLLNRRLPSWQALACLVLKRSDFPEGSDWSTAKSRMLKELAITESDLAKISADRQLGTELLGGTEWTGDGLPEDLAPPSPVEIQSAASMTTNSGDAEPDLAVVVDKRVKSMLWRAVANHPCILLVGPPGTGKGTLLRWLIREISRNPEAFGFGLDLNPAPVWRTPDESWSSFELVGGLVPNSAGELRWSHGLVINALAEQRWLILDETNRADMDKIMGPLLTWLSAQEVEVGRTEPLGGVPVTLGWTPSKRCLVEDPAKTGDPTRFLAGQDWRLIGTYNPQDAQRVFRFGSALSRRFAVVPIPAITPGQFEELLSKRHSGISSEAAEALAGLYSQHHDASETLLGPAVFLRMADYVAGSADNSKLEDDVAEAYVINVGKYLATYDDQTFDELGKRVRDATSLTSVQWGWIESQRNLLS